VVGTRKEGSAEKLEVAAIATPATVVDRHLALLKNNHVRPQKVSTVMVALWNLVQQNKAAAPRNVVIIDIGALSTHILFIEDGRLQFVREVTTAGDEFTEALTSTVYAEGRDLALSPGDAEQLKQECGLPEAQRQGTTANGIPFGQISVMLRPVVDRLVNEVRRSIDYYREKFKTGSVQQIYLTGGSARMSNLPQALATALGIRTEILDPLQAVNRKKFQKDAKLDAVASQLAVAIGLGLDRRKELNLLPPAQQGAFRLRSALRYFRYIVLFTLLGIAAVTGFEYFRSQQFAHDLKRLQLEFDRLVPRRDTFVDLMSRRDGLQKDLSAYQSQIVIHLAAPAHLRALSNLIPPSIVLTSLNVETMLDKKRDGGDGEEQVDFLVMNGIVVPHADKDARRGTREGVALADFLIDLEKSGYFRSIDLRDQKREPDGSIKFTLACFY
jgi:Tfp pilus assembly protein PilN